MKKLSFLLAIILLLSSCLMTACKKDDSKDDPSETTAHAGENPVVYASIATEQLANYEIVSTKTSSAEVDAVAEELRLKMQALFDIPISKKTENAHNKKQYEILIGNTNREETATFLADMKWDDYGYGIVGDKLVIAGKNEDGTLKALRAFLDYINKHDGGTVFFSNANSLLVQMGYPHGAITFNDIPVEELSILCNQQELGGIAQIIRDAIIDVCGIAMPIITDEDVVVGNKLMIIGESAYVSQEFLTDYQEASISENGFYFATDYQAHCWLSANTTAGYYHGVVKLTKILSLKGGGNYMFVGKWESEDAIPVMSFNLKAESKTEDYNKRLDAVVETILKYRPAVIGVQEATDMWIGLLNQKLGDVYAIVGDGRSATKGDEHSAILYLKDEFECLQSGTKWLSDTPEVAGSKFAESHYERIMTYVVLERKSDGQQFLHVNTHLDYGSTSAEEQIKVKQMQVVFDEIAKLPDLPTIITGDFNANVGSPVYNKVIGAGYSEAAEHIPTSERTPTYHALMGTTGEPSHIDYIFAKGLANDNLYRICTERINNENVSDHYPILSVLAFQTEES